MPKESVKTKDTVSAKKLTSPGKSKEAPKATKPVKKMAKATENLKIVEFEIFSPASNIVEIAGTFNDWTPSKLPLKKDKNGVWKGKIRLGVGRHEYKVVFDGSSWELDPNREAIATNLGANNLLVIE